MSRFPLKNPLPNFESLIEILKGEREPRRVPFIEHGVDWEVMNFISENMLGQKLPSISQILNEKKKKFASGEDIILLSDEKEKIFWKRYIDFYYRMGYDYAPDRVRVYLYCMFLAKERTSIDTAILSRKERVWVEEGEGIITSWDDYEKFHWDRIKLKNLDGYYEFMSENLPDGMKITVSGSLFEQVLEKFLGYEGLFYLLYDEPDLVKEVFNRWGNIIYEYYKSVVPSDCVGAVLHGDDLGYKTATMLSPDTLRELVFPWFKKYASLAHRYGKMFWYHCCGNVLEVMRDLIEDVGIDAFHSFQDSIIPVAEFKKRYGNRVAALGGIDMDKLSRFDQESLRKYVREVLDQCMPGGRYALGSGNTISNYIPVKNYLTMLEEGLVWFFT